MALRALPSSALRFPGIADICYWGTRSPYSKCDQTLEILEYVNSNRPMQRFPVINDRLWDTSNHLVSLQSLRQIIVRFESLLQQTRKKLSQPQRVTSSQLTLETLTLGRFALPRGVEVVAPVHFVLVRDHENARRFVSVRSGGRFRHAVNPLQPGVEERNVHVQFL
jgi:hypothetical protein